MAASNFTGVARVRALGLYAGLPLPAEREAGVAAILDAWAPAADELSRKMSDAAHQELLPITVLTHGGDEADEVP
jgi:hypothetical protein